MEGSWIVLGFVAMLLGTLVVLVLMGMASKQDRAARHAEKTMFPDSDVTVTGTGGSEG